MAFLGLRKWPTQVARPLWAFVAATSVTVYLVSTIQDIGVKSDTYKNDPRNPYAEKIARQEKAAHH
ncbi:hypothetical protein BD410DRAFT_789720 [Rickenella mellea]|uniref:ATPase, F0 complex, subunit J n=1 Tax=Rickenella mellea TaxID=50990 RepID=A0A4Y7Q3W6_9AGAM|nr:hypothetical protein BD410DRAFT_789720 [Rickenella mellea]